METIRLLISQAAQLKWKIYQMGVKSTFLNGVLEEEAWNTRISLYLKKNGYVQCPYEHALYVKKDDNKILLVSLFIDDILFVGNDEKMIKEFKEAMTQEFEITHLGLMKYFLGLEIRQDNYGIFVSHDAKEIVKKFDMAECNPVATPMVPGTKFSKFEGGDRVDAGKYRSVVGSLRYLTCTRHDIAYSVGMVSQFMEDPRSSHCKAVRRIIQYIKGTQSLGLFYSTTANYKLIGYSDSNWNGNVDDLKSTSGYIMWQCRGVERVRNEEVQLTHVATRDQVADIFTKALPAELFNDFKMMLGMKDGRDLSLREDFVDDKLKSHVSIAAQK
ncbi:retrovirus-related pol polyprotein from transposon TNT 1-94 [Tanacetum coccineum]